MAALDALALALDPENGARSEAALLNARYGGLGAEARHQRDAPGKQVLDGGPDRRFGAESAVLLHMLSTIDR
ncbi:MAG: phosphoadenosine phosphosulfate reductase, partial [Bauldia sp.]